MINHQMNTGLRKSDVNTTKKESIINDREARMNKKDA